MQQQKLSWGDVVQQVERTGLDDQKLLQLKQRQLRKMYMHDLEQQIALHQHEQQAKSAEKIQERLTIEQQVRLENKKKSQEKDQALRKELHFKDNNYQLLQITHASKPKELPPPEHPFVRLCDEQDRRKALNKQKLRQQNSINDIQLKIKQQQKQEHNQLENVYKQKYVNFVEQFYEKKTQDRNIFKHKYIKLNNLERSHLLNDYNSNQPHSNVQDQYSRANFKQIDDKHQKTAHREQLDDVLSKFNKHLNLPSSSPAFLGRNPINYDRARQLQHIDHSLKLKPLGNFDRMKTEGDQQSHKKQISLGESSPIIQKSFTKIVKTQETQREKEGYSPVYQPMSEKRRFVSDLNLGPLKSQVSRVQGKERKRFTTFDIILGKKKEVYL